MPDPVDPIPTSTSVPTSGGSASSTSTGLPSNVAAALACIPLVGGIIFYILEKRDSFVRFYAIQSIIFGCGWILFSIIWNILYFVLAHIPAIGWVFASLLWLVWTVWSIGAVVIWIIATIKAFMGVRWDIPYIGSMARSQVQGASV